MPIIDETHQIELRSWVTTANQDDTDFPIQNLPYARFRRPDDQRPVLGVGIGNQVLDLRRCADQGILDGEAAQVLAEPCMKPLMALPASQRRAIRQQLSHLLAESNPVLRDNSSLCEQVLVAQSQVQWMLPCSIGDYTDFYASVYHATNVGSMFRPNNPLLPNYKHVPIGYHGRSSSIVISGTDVRRPSGQQAPAEDGGSPSFGPCKLLDYEFEVGCFVAQGNSLGDTISIDQAEDYLFGLCLVNDWSARDIQKWEYQPLGPFLAKSFATSLSPWVVTLEALAPFRCAEFQRAEEDPTPQAYLTSADNSAVGGFDITLEASLASEKMRDEQTPPQQISRGSFRDMYWTLAQMLTHHASNGCNMQPGDLLASGTVSGKDRQSRGCMLELTWDGELGKPVPGTQRTPIQLPCGQERKFLADGDEVILSASCQADGFQRIGFGSCRGVIRPAG